MGTHIVPIKFKYVTREKDQSFFVRACASEVKKCTVKLGYNEQLGASRFVHYNREFIITGVVYVLNMDLGLKNLFVITGGSL